MDKYDFSKLQGFDISKTLANIQTLIPEIEEENTMWYRMEKQCELLKEQLEQQNKHNELLTQNYNQLKELFDLQKGEYDVAKGELAKSKRMNVIMLIIAIVAMLGAIASPLVTWLVTL